MTILIMVRYQSAAGGVLQQGYFKTKAWLYKENPDKEAARVAKEFVRQIKRDNPYEITITEVTYENNDITHLI